MARSRSAHNSISAPLLPIKIAGPPNGAGFFFVPRVLAFVFPAFGAEDQQHLVKDLKITFLSTMMTQVWGVNRTPKMLYTMADGQRRAIPQRSAVCVPKH